jgi:hypothetical protein
MADTLTVEQAWSAVMGDVREVRKGERNQSQNFNFRGIDTVVNAVGPALRKHGVVVVPTPVNIQFHDYETSRGTAMRNATVTMQYEVRGPAGDSFTGGAYGEASDAGDKSVSKAQSVAYRVFLLQSLTIPTDDPDPDAEAHQRVSSPSPTRSAPVSGFRQELLAAAASLVERGKKAEMLAEFAKAGLPTSSKDMSDDEARLALELVKKEFAIA